MTCVVLLLLSLLIPKGVFAHCDTLDGPVVQDARTALMTGDIAPVLKWVRAEDENNIRSVFDRTHRVRTTGTEAKELADLYFFETLVRIHRAGEGAPYTGLKSPDTIDPAVKFADQALETGSVDKLVHILTEAMANGIRARYQDTFARGKQKGKNVAAGREYVKSYVEFTHYVEGLHKLIQGGAAHHNEAE